MVVLWGRGKCPLIRRMSVGRSLARRSSRIYIYGTAQPLDGRTDRAADSSVRIKAYFSHSQRLERLAGLLDTTAVQHICGAVTPGDNCHFVRAHSAFLTTASKRINMYRQIKLTGVNTPLR